MAELSKIAWTNGTFNPWIGCTRVSPGCENCYAENLMANRYKRVEWGPGKPRSRTHTWNDPIKWNRKAKANGVRMKVFCASLADWLDEGVPTQWREDLFDLIESCTHIDWLMLTKRPQNATTMMRDSWLRNPLENVWFGVSAENQKYFDLRVPMMRDIPASLRWVSYEPALGPIDFGAGHRSYMDWLIIGGESRQSQGARVFDIAWAEHAIQRCRDTGVIPFMKQIGSNVVYHGRNYVDFVDPAGANPSEWPHFIKVREFPRQQQVARNLQIVMERLP